MIENDNFYDVGAAYKNNARGDVTRKKSPRLEIVRSRVTSVTLYVEKTEISSLSSANFYTGKSIVRVPR